MISGHFLFDKPPSSGDLTNLTGAFQQATHSVKKTSPEPTLRGISFPGRKPNDDGNGDNQHPPPDRGGLSSSLSSPSTAPSTTPSQKSMLNSGKCVYFQQNINKRYDFNNKKNAMLQFLSNFKISFKNFTTNANQIHCLFTIFLALSMS